MGSLNQYRMYVSSYGKETSPRIHVYSFDAESVTFELIEGVDGIQDPSFLAINERDQVLYAVSEKMEQEGETGGLIASYAIDADNGKLARLNEQPSFGWQPCHLTLTKNNDYIF